VNPADHFKAICHARANGLAVIGAYHSHPRSPPQPSHTDIREANDPGFVHVIVSLMNAEPQVAAFRIEDGRAIQLQVAAVDG